tara:strand:+ start:3965 stop:4147 length:183 start_codon:yes stop_codon:yes gene_type:complete
MDLITDYSEEKIKDMVKVYNNHLKTKEYRKNYYRNKYQNDEEFRKRKKLHNKKYNDKIRN